MREVQSLYSDTFNLKIYYILPFFSCNWNALGSTLLQSSDSTVAELLILLFWPILPCKKMLSSNCCPFMTAFSLGNKQKSYWAKSGGILHSFILLKYKYFIKARTFVFSHVNTVCLAMAKESTEQNCSNNCSRKIKRALTDDNNQWYNINEIYTSIYVRTQTFWMPLSSMQLADPNNSSIRVVPKHQQQQYYRQIY